MWKLTARGERGSPFAELGSFASIDLAAQKIIDTEDDPHGGVFLRVYVDPTHAPSDALCTALQVLNHLQDCAKDLAMLDRCYLPLDMLRRHGATIEDLRGARQTAGLRGVFDALLYRVDALNAEAADLPRHTRSRRLRLETAIIVGLARRLTQRLRHGDPLATRVALTKGDAVASVVASLRYLR